ncbi:MAG: flavodoxin family protein [Deltaproteobacteria bacterium]|nr:flavodoxin family protein [Deltaproteobacteria bacterium]
MIRVLGICGSPVKNSNAELILKDALKAIEQDDVQTDFFGVQGKSIKDCIQCNWCMGEQSKEDFCAVRDDLQELYPKVVKADALLVSSPVYLARMSGHLASVLDRLRCVHYGKHWTGGMKHKVGAAIAVSWYRNSGIETTLTSIHWAFLTYQMVIGVPGSLSTFGGAGLTSLAGTGAFDVKDKHQVLKDEYGLNTARATARSMLALAKIIKAGKRA